MFFDAGAAAAGGAVLPGSYEKRMFGGAGGVEAGYNYQSQRFKMTSR